jgi:hypothetical protein
MEDDPAFEPLTGGKWHYSIGYCFAASIPFKVGSASIAAEAFCMAISIESALGGMLGGMLGGFGM